MDPLKGAVLKNFAEKMWIQEITAHFWSAIIQLSIAWKGKISKLRVCRLVFGQPWGEIAIYSHPEGGCGGRNPSG